MTTDFLTGPSGDLIIQNGDFVTGDSQGKHISDHVVASKGDFKRTPLTGGGFRKMINAPGTPEVLGRAERDLKISLESDRFTIINLKINSFQDIKVNATRN